MTDEVQEDQEVQDEQAPEGEAATETATDEIGDTPAAEAAETTESEDPVEEPEQL